MVVANQAQAGASASAQQSTEERRRGLLRIAQQSLGLILEGLVERIREAAPAATVTRSPNLVVQLGNGMLSVNSIQPAPPRCLAAFGGPSAFDVIAYTTIAVQKPRDRFGYEGRSHSLWFCDAHDEGVYRWFEMAFMIYGMTRAHVSIDPFAIDPTDEDAAGAFWSGISVRQVAWEPVPFDQGNEEQFIER